MEGLLMTTFDPKCWDLAAHFLADVPGSTDEDRAELAEALQEAAEDFLSDLECCSACGACPGFIGAECDETCDHAKKEA
jgi:hypothetical protein